VAYRLYLFGPPRLEHHGRLLELPLRKGLALLAYLALTRQPHSRDALATLFWPDKDQPTARANLRRTLYELGQALPTPLLELNADTVRLAPNSDLWLDVAQFQHLLAASSPAAAAPAQLEQAATLYTADLLAGFSLPDCPEFDEWQFFMREALRRDCATLLTQLTDAYQAQQAWEPALRNARRWLVLDPLEESVHRRLMQLYAYAGQPGAALRQYEECVRLLAQELEVPPAEETTALYTAIRSKRFPPPAQAPASRAVPALPAAPPPAAPALNRGRAALPVSTTPFVGRRQELAELLRRLAEPECRLLTLVGPGGIGKTRLALHLAQTILDGADRIALHSTSPPGAEDTASTPATFRDGVFFVPLQDVRAASGLIAAIAEATGFHFYSDTPPREQLINFLREKQMLLVLDSMEHLPEGSPLLSELLAAAPGIKLLVTSQRSLNLHEEWFHPLAGMMLPRPNGASARISMDGGSEISDTLADAMQLFVQCAQRAHVAFDLDVEREHVVRICRLVDGMPLAIELAAAWLKVLPCKQIADEIERSLDILTARYRNIPARHRSMHAVLEQTWQQLLDGAEQDALKRLAVFRGGFTKEAAQEVADASLLMLAALVDKALIWFTPTRRYQMHALLRKYAYEQLAADPRAERMTRARHCAYTLRLLSERARLLTSQAQRSVLDAIGHEIENIRLGWDWAVQQKDLDALDQAVEPLYHFFQIQSRYQEGKEVFAQAWAHLQHLSETGEGPHTPAVLLRILARCGAFSYFLCEYEEAGRGLQGCLPRAETLGQRGEVAFVLNYLGQLAVWQGEQELAKQYLLRSLAISRELGDTGGTASALEKLANLTHATFGEYAESKQLAAQSLALSRELGRLDRVGYALDTLGYITFCLGEYHEAEAYYRESLAAFEAIDDQYGIAMALGGIGLVLWATQHQEAATYLEKSLSICRTIGHQGQVAGRLAGLARIANDRGDYAHACQVAQEGVVIARQLGGPVYLSHLLYCLGESAYALGDLAVARTYLLEAMQITSQTGLLSYLAIALYHYAILLTKESQSDPRRSRQNQARAAELLALVEGHPATWHVYRERAKQQTARLEVSRLSGEDTSPAQEQGRQRSLDEVVAAILAEAAGSATAGAPDA
jgi:DNA-binding SARP family transcriptional activator/predicted ATPase